MRILHAIHTPRFSGAEMLVAALAKKHTISGNPSAVVSFNPAEKDFLPVIEEQLISGVEWYSPLLVLKGWRRSCFYRKTINSFKPDVIFSHSVIPSAYARVVAGRSVIPILHSEKNYEGGLLKKSELILQYFSAGVISVSDLAKDEYSKNFGYPETVTIKNGVDLNEVRGKVSDRENIRASMNIENDAIVILQVGRLDRIKQQHLSLHALAPLLRSNPKYKFFLVGLIEDLSYLEELNSFINFNGLHHQVSLLGPRKDIAEILAAADVFLMPSAREAHSIAMLEALASGLPIVASSIPSFQYAKTHAGVQLVNPLELATFTAAIASAASNMVRHPRSLVGFDIQDTARAYLQFAKKCTS